MTNQHVLAEEGIEYSGHLLLLSRHLLSMQEEEKTQLSAALHNRTSPNLAAIALNLCMIATESLSPKQNELLGDVRALLNDTIASLREFSSDLRPPLLDYVGLVPAVSAYVRRFAERTGIAATLACVHVITCRSPELESLLFRIIQEALNHCAKHTTATTIDIDLSDDDNTVTLTVQDNGIGLTPDNPGQAGNTPGIGLSNVQAMTELAGGQFFIESSPGHGTAIRVEI